MRQVHVGRRSAVALVATDVALVFAGVALANEVGNYQWDSNYGTRATVAVSSFSPSTNCIASASYVTSTDSNRQLQIGQLLCASGYGVDGTCSLSNNFILYVGRIPATGSAVCYPHGSASGSYLLTVDDSAGSGTFYTYASGTQYEGQSGYDSSRFFSEGSEYTGSSCSGWSGSTSFSGWQYYNLALNQWQYVTSPVGPSAQCWSVSSYNGTSHSFTVSH